MSFQISDPQRQHLKAALKAPLMRAEWPNDTLVMNTMVKRGWLEVKKEWIRATYHDMYHITETGRAVARQLGLVEDVS